MSHCLNDQISSGVAQELMYGKEEEEKQGEVAKFSERAYSDCLYHGVLAEVMGNPAQTIGGIPPAFWVGLGPAQLQTFCRGRQVGKHYPKATKLGARASRRGP